MLNLRCAVVVLFLMACNDGAAQIQQAWVARYNNGISNGTNQAVKMTLDSAGNIYVAGFSQNTNNQLGYVAIKYAPNGTQLWVARYDSTNYPTATPAGLALDGSNNVAVTGGALTVKYDSNGNQLWTAPYAGTTLAEDNQGSSYVGGFSQDFGFIGKVCAFLSNCGYDMGAWKRHYCMRFSAYPRATVRPGRRLNKGAYLSRWSLWTSSMFARIAAAGM